MPNVLYLKFIDFFKKHNLYDETIFKYIRENAILFDYLEEEKRPFIGCYYNYDKNKCLSKITVVVPIINDERTLLINIHEYTHAIIIYNKLGKKYKIEKDIEMLPMLYERIYLEENKKKALEKYVQGLNQRITEDSEIEYQIALKYQRELLEYYYQTYDFNKLQKKAKKLSRKYTR